MAHPLREYRKGATNHQFTYTFQYCNPKQCCLLSYIKSAFRYFDHIHEGATNKGRRQVNTRATRAVVALTSMFFVGALLLSTAEPAQAAKWCLKGNETTSCAYNTLKQCQAARVGGHGTCFRARRGGGGSGK